MKKVISYLLITFCYFITHAQNVGIGTTAPTARLHVADSSVIFSAVGLAPFNAGNTPLQGNGRRMMWYADKAAFRSGYAISDEWDKANIGNYSFAAGYGVSASGDFSFSAGQNNFAYGRNSIAIGNNANSYPDYSVAIGSSVFATGEGATALGIGSTAQGKYSLAMGYGSFVKSLGGTVLGQLNDISDNPDPNDTSSLDRIFQIGNGYFDEPNLVVVRKNVITVLRNGNTGIGTVTPAASALLDLSSNSKGILIPRLTTAERNSISNPVKGLLVFDNTNNGFFFFNGTTWRALIAKASDSTTQVFNLGNGGGRISWIVPEEVYQVKVELHGGRGGSVINSGTGSAGLAGMVNAIINVTPGETINFFLGSRGSGFIPSREDIIPFNGGTTGWGSGSMISAGGGGATDIRRGGIDLSNRILVAGAGGGGFSGYGSSTSISGAGGCGDYPNGCSGDSANLQYTRPGHGGTQSAGGINYGNAAKNGSFGQGGGVNGGGGYFGGAGGNQDEGGGGGGGSSWASATATNVSYATSGLLGGGYAKISYAGTNPGLTTNFLQQFETSNDEVKQLKSELAELKRMMEQLLKK